MLAIRFSRSASCLVLAFPARTTEHLTRDAFFTVATMTILVISFPIAPVCFPFRDIRGLWCVSLRRFTITLLVHGLSVTFLGNNALPFQADSCRSLARVRRSEKSIYRARIRRPFTKAARYNVSCMQKDKRLCVPCDSSLPGIVLCFSLSLSCARARLFPPSRSLVPIGMLRRVRSNCISSHSTRAPDRRTI